MKITSSKSILAAVICSSLAFYQPVSAKKIIKNTAQEQKTLSAVGSQNSEEETAAKANSNKIINKNKYAIQNFVVDALNVEFRYNNGRLKTLKITNQADYSVMITCFGRKQVLGSKDSIMIDPPNVEYLYILNQRYSGIDTMIDVLFPLRFSQLQVYHLPKQE